MQGICMKSSTETATATTATGSWQKQQKPKNEVVLSGMKTGEVLFPLEAPIMRIFKPNQTPFQIASWVESNRAYGQS